VRATFGGPARSDVDFEELEEKFVKTIQARKPKDYGLNVICRGDNSRPFVWVGPYSDCLAAFAWRLTDTEDSHAHAVHVKKAARRNCAAGYERYWSWTAR
jgi:hypothetical protein